MPVFEDDDFDDHEQVVFCRDAASGLTAIIAVHNTNLGPSLGGCRFYPYPGSDAALTDVLRLSRGMTYKAAMAGLPLGGGKAVIVGDPGHQKTEALLRAFGRHVDQLGRRYITTEDVGTSVADMDIVKTVTDHVTGISGGAGDPSPSTAHGVYIGIQAAVRHKLGRGSLAGLTVAVQGVGNVGYHLCGYLAKAGATLVVTDISQTSLERVAAEFGAKVVEPDAIGAAVPHQPRVALDDPDVAGGDVQQRLVEAIPRNVVRVGRLRAPDLVEEHAQLLLAVQHEGGSALQDAVARDLLLDTETAEVGDDGGYEGLADDDRRALGAVEQRHPEARLRQERGQTRSRRPSTENRDGADRS